MEKLKNNLLGIAAFFYKDVHWKLLALTMAFLLWFVGVNVTNPIENTRYDNLPLNVLGRDQLAHNNLVLLNEQQLNNARVDVAIRATRSSHTLINAARNDNIQAFIDLSTINFDQVLEAEGILDIPLDVNIFIHQEYSTRTMTPSTITLELDQHEERRMPIEVDVIGVPAEGFENRDSTHSPRVVRLTGARSVLEAVTDVRVRVYINDAFETVEEPRPLVVYNSAREDITNTLSLSVPSSNVIVPILPYADIPLRVETTGQPLPGFMATEINIYPSEVTVVGNPDVIEEMDFINLGAVDLNLANQRRTQQFDIRQALTGTGLTIREGFADEIVVTVEVERVIERDLMLPLENLAVNGYNRPFVFEDEGPIVLTMRGRESVINALTLSQIGASVDLTGLGAGTHQVLVDVVPPPRAALANLATVTITIEPEPLVFEPEEPPDWTADIDEEEGEGDGEEAEGDQ